MTRRKATAAPTAEPRVSRAGSAVVDATPPKDAAHASVGVEARHRAAHAMVARFTRPNTLRAHVMAAIAKREHLCTDSVEDCRALVDAIMAEIEAGDDARFLRELLGEDPADRATRLHAHGALLERAAQAAWRLSGGT